MVSGGQAEGLDGSQGGRGVSMKAWSACGREQIGVALQQHAFAGVQVPPAAFPCRLPTAPCPQLLEAALCLALQQKELDSSKDVVKGGVLTPASGGQTGRLASLFMHAGSCCIAMLWYLPAHVGSTAPLMPAMLCSHGHGPGGAPEEGGPDLQDSRERRSIRLGAAMQALQRHFMNSKQTEQEVAQAADTRAGAAQSKESASGALSALFGSAVHLHCAESNPPSFMFYDSWQVATCQTGCHKSIWHQKFIAQRCTVF